MDETTLRRVDRALADHYGHKVLEAGGDPLGGLIATILSQNTTAANSQAAFRSLVAQFGDWEAVAEAEVERIAEAIRVGGLSDQKARWIKQILAQVRREQGILDLAFLGRAPTQEALTYLRSFRGVGPKTAACVLLFELGRPVFPVDTHVHRIAGRLGWIGPQDTAERAHEILGSLVPHDLCYELHVNLVEHGRILCRPRDPRCDTCPIAGDCEWWRARLHREPSREE
ncbi:endonuclease III [bacterium]|nr:endonuclease III [bacterium]